MASPWKLARIEALVNRDSNRSIGTYDQKTPSPDLLRRALIDLGLDEVEVRATNKWALRKKYRDNFLEQAADKEPTTELAQWEVDRLCDQLYREVTMDHLELLKVLTKEEEKLDFSLEGTPVENRVGSIQRHISNLTAISVNNELLYDVGQIRSDPNSRWNLQMELLSEDRFGVDYLCISENRYSLRLMTDQTDRVKYANRWVYTLDSF